MALSTPHGHFIIAKNKIYFEFQSLHIQGPLVFLYFSGHFTSVGSAFINSSPLLALWISTTASKIYL